MIDDGGYRKHARSAGHSESIVYDAVTANHRCLAGEFA